jgi:hypothetical protein
MSHPLTPDGIQRHTAAIRVSRITQHLSDLVSSVRDIEEISSSADASLRDVAQDLEMAQGRHSRKANLMSALESTTSYKVFSIGRAAASSAQRSLFFAHEALLIHQQALKVHAGRVERLKIIIRRYHKFAKTSAHLMEEALDLSVDIHMSVVRSQQATSGTLDDHPGSSDKFEDYSDGDEILGINPVLDDVASNRGQSD